MGGDGARFHARRVRVCLVLIIYKSTQRVAQWCHCLDKRVYTYVCAINKRQMCATPETVPTQHLFTALPFLPRVNKTARVDNKEIWIALQIVHMSHIRNAPREMLFKFHPLLKGKKLQLPA